MSTLFQSVPAGWKRTSLRHLAQGPKNGAWGSEAGEDEIDAVCVRVADFDWSRLSLKLSDPTTRSFKKQQFKNLQLRSGDIVIEKSGGGEKTPVGRVVSFDEDVDAVTSNFVARVRPYKDVWNRYFLYLIAAHYMSGYSHQFIKQNTGIQNLDDRNLFRSDVWVPDISIQRQIADFLDRETARIDQLIEEKQRLVALLGEKTEETIRQCISWGLNPNVSKRPSRVLAGDDLAEHWGEQPLSTICRFVQGKAHEPFIEEDGKYVCVTARFVSTNGEKYRRCTKNLTPAKVNDIAMVMSDLPNGRALARAFLIDQNRLYAINQRVCLITVREGDPRFFCYQLNRNIQLLRYNDGFNQTHLPNRAFTKLYLKVPPVDEQKRIADYLDTVTQKTTVISHNTNASIDRLKEYRSALITAAVTGQINVQHYGRSGTVDRQLDAIQEELEV
ncbi:restriction endonuclease subunit S [Limimaricola variabilis]|uniref:restriction endonuclease subunit S n=1 Tax=Limimaricola variabilis TaxID=1492771 RepID=UPI002AC9130B|nr:restriction endonuclease subunit S [Limimaricola variabilis]WPY95635.1 restriction endonuclease subunit S [Limimaricola variabilis]